jgi:hypothetical protein
MPWAMQRPVPDALRAIVNRATASQERQRYLNARTLLRALNGWHEVDGQDNGGPLALLLDRLHSVGHLPAMAGVGRRVARVVAAENCRTDELAGELLQDMALSLELLRQVNSALLQGAHTADGAAVITVRRAVALLGVNGVRRAANSLRTWPGPLSAAAADRLQRVIDRVRLAAPPAPLAPLAAGALAGVQLVWEPAGALVDPVAALEAASYPADEAASRARLAERMAVAGPFFLVALAAQALPMLCPGSPRLICLLCNQATAGAEAQAAQGQPARAALWRGGGSNPLPTAPPACTGHQLQR